MQQENAYRYVVEPGELVTTTVMAMNGARSEAVSAAVDGTALVNIGAPTQLRYEFEASSESDHRHNLVLAFGFVSQDPDGSYYDIEFSGSNGDNYPANRIHKEDGYQEPEYVFKVRPSQ